MLVSNALQGSYGILTYQKMKSALFSFQKIQAMGSFEFDSISTCMPNYSLCVLLYYTSTQKMSYTLPSRNLTQNTHFNFSKCSTKVPSTPFIFRKYFRLLPKIIPKLMISIRQSFGNLKSLRKSMIQPHLLRIRLLAINETQHIIMLLMDQANIHCRNKLKR